MSVTVKVPQNLRSLPLSERQKLTPPQLAKLWGIDSVKILAWITSGQLRAINAATNPGGLPRYLIDRRDIQAFEQVRQAAPAPVSTQRRRRSAPGVKEFV